MRALGCGQIGRKYEPLFQKLKVWRGFGSGRQWLKAVSIGSAQGSRCLPAIVGVQLHSSQHILLLQTCKYTAISHSHSMHPLVAAASFGGGRSQRWVGGRGRFGSYSPPCSSRQVDSEVIPWSPNGVTEGQRPHQLNTDGFPHGNRYSLGGCWPSRSILILPRTLYLLLYRHLFP